MSALNHANEYAKKNNSEVLLVSAKIESEISQISDENENRFCLSSLFTSFYAEKLAFV